MRVEITHDQTPPEPVDITADESFSGEKNIIESEETPDVFNIDEDETQPSDKDITTDQDIMGIVDIIIPDES